MKLLYKNICIIYNFFFSFYENFFLKKNKIKAPIYTFLKRIDLKFVDISKFETKGNKYLEKIIFPIPSEYTKFKNLIDGFNTTCFVNLPRRLFPHYQLIKGFTLNSNSFEATITGSSWGLLSNSLHFIDLIHFLFRQFLFELQNLLLFYNYIYLYVELNIFFF